MKMTDDEIKILLALIKEKKAKISLLSTQIGELWESVLKHCPHTHRSWYADWEGSIEAVGECELCGSSITKSLESIDLKRKIGYLEDGTEVKLTI